MLGSIMLVMGRYVGVYVHTYIAQSWKCYASFYTMISINHISKVSFHNIFLAPLAILLVHTCIHSIIA